jgi:predicted DNA-binding transcriptional regulator AlpA
MNSTSSPACYPAATSPAALPHGLTEDDVLLAFEQTRPLTGGAERLALYRWEKAGRFPRRVVLPGGGVRWRLSELRAWQKQVIAGELVPASRGRLRGRHLNAQRAKDAAAVAA